METNEKISADIKIDGKVLARITHLNAAGEVISVETSGTFEDNMVVNTGLTYINQLIFGGGSAQTMYGFLTTNNYTVVAADTMVTYLTNAGEFTAYNAATRPIYQGQVFGVNVTNANNKLVYTINQTGTVRGIALVLSNNIKGNNGGTLFSGIQFAAAKNVSAGDTLNVEYTFATASD